MDRIIEIIRITQQIQKTNLPLINICSPTDAVEITNKYIADEDREVLLIMVLNTKNQIIAIHRCHIGSLSASVAHPREIFKAAILNNAASIIIAHNHPSGIVTPSQEDIKLTQRVAECGEMLGIELLDHLIVGWQEGYYSFKSSGLL
ncbi:DNA repair protein RadC [Paenibacillus sp. LMG 31459]|uniref:DNA repair protein RadC n=1 Tax=Paenibacillus phytohabitans TaxID=2654978 RepID=A0ABX1YRU6_9BACL|nr:JAB domain-containing protein [Paenibacillus phytohabitans]NOU82309.1 DNA repair protein RadC [Paenibacillus phytohabitans]